ncbi:hypothetical protein F5883DRAFT_622431 [Diaporthe sp. PMI_573]|nr:hypothetical protein F5883DRAFT_622431 [Diaporthaceae sp. PMI_573]
MPVNIYLSLVLLVDHNTASLSYAFFNKAQRLHREESTGNPQYQFAIPNIAATQLLSLAATCHGRNALAMKYLAEGIELAHQNGLLAVGRKESARNWLDDHVDYVKAASHTAWGTFCRATLLGMNYQTAYIRIPPWLPIPGTDFVRSDDELESFELPAYMGQSFTNCPFLLDNFAADNPSPEGVCDASVSQLKHLILIFRARYPCATSTMLWQNALLYVANACLPLRGPAHPAGATGDVHSSRNADEMEGVTTTTTTAMGYGEPTDEKIAESEEDADRRKWFTACIDALRALAPQFDIVTGIVKGILSMAILKGSIAAVEGRTIMDQLKAGAGVSNRHRRADFYSRSTAGSTIQAVAVADGGDEDEVDKEEVERGAGVGAAGGLVVGGGEREASETFGRVVYGFSGGLGGDAAALAISGLVNLPGAQPGGNGFVIDLNEASVNPSAASLDVLARAFDELAMFDEFTTSEE